MINGLGVLGWGVGGIEAEAAMLGQPVSMLVPQVVGFKLTGTLREGATATDLVLTATQMLRKKGVVGKFVEYYGAGLAGLPLADRATLANMAPEYGATCGLFPIDAETIRYLAVVGPVPRDDPAGRGVRQGSGHVSHRQLAGSDVFRHAWSWTCPRSSRAWPARGAPRTGCRFPKPKLHSTPHSRSCNPPDLPRKTRPPYRLVDTCPCWSDSRPRGAEPRSAPKRRTTSLPTAPPAPITHGSVVIAAITSCTNTSNPSVMVAAGLLAKKAVEHGLATKPWVKASLAPGSKVVTDYLKDAGLDTFLDQLRFNLVGYGCTTCIGNSGPLPTAVSESIQKDDLVAVAVLSGNRNFEGRINPDVRANYLASPPLVVAYALAGTMDIDFQTEPLGSDPKGDPVFLKDIWPSQREIEDTIQKSVRSEMFQKQYAEVFEGDATWSSLPVPQGDLYEWDPAVDVRQEPPVFRGHAGRAGAGRSDRQGEGSGLSGRQYHDRPHLTGRLDQEGRSGRPLLDRARRGPRRLQFVWSAARQ